jgi:hypothetical protein
MEIIRIAEPGIIIRDIFRNSFFAGESEAFSLCGVSIVRCYEVLWLSTIV